jgi:hypothetical protein
MRLKAAQTAAPGGKKLSMYKVLEQDAKKELTPTCDYFLFQKMKISYEG